MDICIELPGSIKHGLWSPERGESRWMQNLARAFAQGGHKVVCICHDALWGDCPPVPGVTLIGWEDERWAFPSQAAGSNVFDVYIDACWRAGKEAPAQILARNYLHAHYAWENHCADPNHIRDNHYIIIPYRAFEPRFYGPWNPFIDRTFLLPCPAFDIEPRAPQFENNRIIWTSKDAFHDRFLDDSPWVLDNASELLEALTQLSKRYPSLPIYFFMSEELIPELFPGVRSMEGKLRDGTKALDQYNVRERVRAIESGHLLGEVTFNRASALISMAQILAPAHITGSQIEGTAYGVACLTRKGWILDSVAEELGILLPVGGAGADRIYDVLDRLMHDKDLYTASVKGAQRILADHSSRFVLEAISRFERR